MFAAFYKLPAAGVNVPRLVGPVCCCPSRERGVSTTAPSLARSKPNGDAIRIGDCDTVLAVEFSNRVVGLGESTPD